MLYLSNGQFFFLYVVNYETIYTLVYSACMQFTLYYHENVLRKRILLVETLATRTCIQLGTSTLKIWLMSHNFYQKTEKYLK